MTREEQDEFVTKNSVATAEGYICLICGRTYSKNNQKRHFRDLHFNTEISYRCPVCKKTYSTRNTFTNHIYVRHKNVKGLDFERCRVVRE